MKLSPRWGETGYSHHRMVIFSIAAGAIFLLLLLRLWYLQIIHHDQFQKRSDQNRTRVLSVAAPRGPIFDRYGELLVDSRPSFDICIMRQDVQDRTAVFKRLSDLLEIEIGRLEANWKKGRHLPNYKPVVLARDVGRDALERVMEHSVELSGVLPQVRPVRLYVHRQMASHLLGYLGEMTAEDFKRPEYRGYQVGEFIGQSGLEKKLDYLLKGQRGKRLLEVNVRGNLLRQIETQAPKPGKKVYLTLSRKLQAVAEKALAGKAGAAVALEINTGRVLAMASKPGFDPSLFAAGISADVWEGLLNDSRLPLQNKAIAGQYPPGSTFKMVVALAALKDHVAQPSTAVRCDGQFQLGDSTFRCWKRRGHKKTDLKKALRESCDVWFYQVGLELGIERIAEMSHWLGLGQRTGIGLDGEKPGLIPDRNWKMKRFGTGWYGGETVISSIGQGAVLTTPLQLAVMTAAIANGGTVYRPQLIERIQNWQGTELQGFEPQVLKKTRFTDEEIGSVKAGIEAVVEEKRGTGWRARLPGIRSAGKTGTSQVVRRLSEEEEKKIDDDDIPYDHRDHALYVGYAPADNPEIAVAVVVEHGGNGSTTASPIAAEMLRSYFDLPPLPDLSTVPYGEVNE